MGHGGAQLGGLLSFAFSVCLWGAPCGYQRDVWNLLGKCLPWCPMLSPVDLVSSRSRDLVLIKITSERSLIKDRIAFGLNTK